MQGAQLLAQHAVNVPPGIAVTKVEDVAAAAKEMAGGDGEVRKEKNGGVDGKGMGGWGWGWGAGGGGAWLARASVDRAARRAGWWPTWRARHSTRPTPANLTSVSPPLYHTTTPKKKKKKKKTLQVVVKA